LREGDVFHSKALADRIRAGRNARIVCRETDTAFRNRAPERFEKTSKSMLLRLPWVKLRKMTSFQMNADMGTPVAGNPISGAGSPR